MDYMARSELGDYKDLYRMQVRFGHRTGMIPTPAFSRVWACFCSPTYSTP